MSKKENKKSDSNSKLEKNILSISSQSSDNESNNNIFWYYNCLEITILHLNELKDILRTLK